MKLKNYFLAILAVAGIAAGCEKNESGQEGDPKLTANPTTLEFAASGSEMSKTITVTSNREWKIAEDLDAIGWIRATVDGKSIAGEKIPASSEPVIVTITVEDNASFPREQVLTLNGGTKAKATVTVKQEGNVSYNTIQEVIDAYKGQSKDTLVLADMVIKATVISNASLDNMVSSKSMYIQDETAGINVFMAANHSFAFGDVIAIDLNGVPVIKYAGVPEITACPLDAATTLSSGTVVEPIEIEVSDMKTGKYEARYVKINDVQVVESDLTKTWVMNSAATSINIETRTGDSFIVRSGKYSKFGTETVAQGSGYICGICTTFNGTPQLYFGQDSDRQNMTNERFGKEESDMVIDPASVSLPASGSASALKATVSVTRSRDWKVSTAIPEWMTVTANGESVEDVTFPGGTDPVVLTVTVTTNTGMDRAQGLVLNDATTTKNILTVKQGGAVAYNTLKEVLDEFTQSGETEHTISDKTIKAYVISNGEMSNLTSNKSLYIQDETAGINIFFDANHSLNFGDEVLISLKGAKIKLFSGAPEILSITTDVVTVLSTGNQIAPIEVPFADFSAGKYEARYIKIKDVQVVESDLTKTWIMNSSATSINIETKDGATFVVRSGKYSTFGSETVAQGSGYICGIATTYSSDKQIIFAQEDDRKHMTDERFQIETENKTIAQVIAAGSGNAITEGRVIHLGPRGFVMNDGASQNLYVYTKSAPAVAKGDIVKVTGAFKTYGNLVEYSEPTVESSTASIPASPEVDPVALSDDDIVNYTGDKSSKLVSFKGTLTISGNYINVNLATTEAVTGSVESVESLSDYAGMEVKVTGYFIGTASSGKFFTIVLSDIEASSDPFLKISPEGTTTVSCSTTSLDIKVTGNVDWTANSDNAEFQLDATSGQGNATINVSFPANTDPNNAKTAKITVSSQLGDKTLTITQKKYTESQKFVKVTKAPTDWSGTYLAVFTKDDNSYAFDGSLTSDVAGNYVDVTVSSGEIECTDELEAKTITLEKVGTGYSVKVAGGKYIYGTNDQNKINFSDTATAVAVSMSDGLVTLSSGEKSNFQMYIAKTGTRVRFYKSTQVLPSLYKLEE